MQGATNGSTDTSSIGYDPFIMPNVGHALPSTTGYNPYAEEHTSLPAGNGPYYPNQATYTSPLQPVTFHGSALLTSD